METAPLKTFATWARTSLIREVTARITAVLAPGSTERVEQPGAVAALEKAVQAAGGGDHGRASVADTVAYTWFNRIIALRFMDANGYTGIGIVSPQAGVAVGQPEILAEAKRGVIDADVASQKTRATVAGLLEGTLASGDPQGEAYALLLADYCRYWNKAMPFMFEREGDFTELLIPANLMSDDSVLNRAVKVLTEDVCQDVEIIGWLYQFYISERKDEVFAGFKKGKKAGAEEIPAATQLFTPDWIVRYLVENTVGRLWMLNRPSSRLIDQMDYYIAPVDDEINFLKIAKPEELTVIDPACGSGHMLTYAFDLLYAIYVEDGYAPSEIPGLILAHNLHGAEIDPRAGALAAFALAMKARAAQRTFFANDVQPNICVLENVDFETSELDYLWSMASDHELARADADEFWRAFANADTIGSLISVDHTQLGIQTAAVASALSNDLVAEIALVKARRVLSQAEYLAIQYHVLIANPPYMGSGNMGATLSEYVKRAFPNDKQDLYSCFVSHAYRLTEPEGLIGMVVGDTWMTLSSFEGFRRQLLEQGGLVSCLHLDDVSNHPDVFGANTAFILERGNAANLHCTFVHLEPMGSERKREQLLNALLDPESELVYRVASSEFQVVPGCAFVYRMSEHLREVFAKFPQMSTVGDARQGLSPGLSERFVRFWFEVSRDNVSFDSADGESARLSGRRWFPFNKGGPFRRWYGNIDHVINWHEGGRELLDYRPRSVIRNPQYYFQPAVTWSSVSSGEAAFRAVDPGVIFSDVGQSIFAEDATRTSLLAILNSRFGNELLALLAPNLHFQAGVIAKLPVCMDMDPCHREVVEDLIAVARRDWNTQETATGFESPDWLPRSLDVALEQHISSRFDAWIETTHQVLLQESELDALVQQAYGLGDNRSTRRSLSRVSLINNPLFGTEEVELESARVAFARRTTHDLISYAVGCMFGRFSLDEQGLVLADQGETVQDYLKKVSSPTFMPDADNVIPIVDGEWFEDDIVERFRQFLRAAFGDQYFEENLRFVSESLGVKSLRDYFVKSFYKDHVQRYRKRPIYWLFSSPSGSFNALIYIHRYTSSTVSTVLNEYLREFQAKLKASLEHAEGSNNGKEADRLRKMLLELDGYEHDVLYPLASQNIAIDLDDGVKVNYPKFGAALKKIPGLEASE